MPRVLVSFRNQGQMALTRKLYRELGRRFGKISVSRDTDAFGTIAEVGQHIVNYTVVVVIIDKAWLEARNAQVQSWPDAPNDLVRATIAEAIKQKKPVIAVLIDDALMPISDALPPEIAKFAEARVFRVTQADFRHQVGELISEIDLALSPKGPEAPPHTWGTVWITYWLKPMLERYGRRGMVALTGFMIVFMLWWFWDDVRKRPLIGPLVERITEQTLPKAVPGKFNIAVAHLDGDNEKRETERSVLESISEFPGVSTLSFDRTIRITGGNREEAERKGHERARLLLKESYADVLIWGLASTAGDRIVPKLYWTAAEDNGQSPSGRRYEFTQDLSLPSMFWEDLTEILGLLIASRGQSEFDGLDGRLCNADNLGPLIQRVRSLLQNSEAKQWNAGTRGQVLVIFGQALLLFDPDFGKGALNREAEDAFREALSVFTVERDRVKWADAQNGLGVALLAHAPDKAIDAFREALRTYTNENALIERANLLNNLGFALHNVGNREGNPDRLDQAADAFGKSLEISSKLNSRLLWAKARGNLGLVAVSRGQSQSDPEQFKLAVDIQREVLKVCAAEGKGARFLWAQTQLNLGTALIHLWNVQPDPQWFEQAMAAYSAAFEVFTRDATPDVWAATNVNMGLAFYHLGLRESGSARFNQAETFFREAIKVYANRDARLSLAQTQDKLGLVLAMRGYREANPQLHRQAVDAYCEALKVFRNDSVQLDWAATQGHLGDALVALSVRDPGTARLKEAVNAYRAFLKGYMANTLVWSKMQHRLGNVYFQLGNREPNLEHLLDAAIAYQAALNGLREAKGDPSLVDETEKGLRSTQTLISERKQAGAVSFLQVFSSACEE